VPQPVDERALLLCVSAGSQEIRFSAREHEFVMMSKDSDSR
jgi:hypothetical protein